MLIEIKMLFEWDSSGYLGQLVWDWVLNNSKLALFSFSFFKSQISNEI